MSKKKPTPQEVAVDILSQIFCTITMDDVVNACRAIMNQYGLMEDPFTGFPCTPEEWAESNVEYQRQMMEQKYGYYED